ncbi:HAMP domain-containing sensor histidine kinase [Microbacterium sp. KR10-403]|uniref:sensor histidine kinase n=1 Tax=Microbacterium sp. KR10-403 TaxID=3158581 RepID=UPI0032E527CC
MHEPAPGPPMADRTRDRAALLNQLMLAGVVAVATFLAFAPGFAGDLALLFAGAALVFLLTGAVLLVPWHRLHREWLLVIPAGDILAVGMMRFAEGSTGIGLLWVFPAMWLAADFGLVGIVGGMAASMALFGVALAHDPDHVIGMPTLLLPMTILAVSVVTFVNARRAAAQRTLLDAQARALGRALERTQRQERELLATLEARDELVASVSHELRTPLTSIMGYLDLVLEDPSVPARARRNVEVAGRNAERLLGITRDILAASQRTHDAHTRVELQRADADVADIILRSSESLTPRAAERRISIDTHAVRPLSAHIDAPRLRQVLDNLIANAIIYNSDGGTLALTTRTADADVEIVVRDDGPGIPAEDLPQLFQRFYRGRAARESMVAGTGLGLAISRDIVRAHGGDILVDSAPGRGTTFTVRLPGAASTPKEDADGA